MRGPQALRALFGLLVFIASVATPTSPSRAQTSGHIYSVGIENSQPNIGVYVRRWDRNIAAGGTCAANFSPPWIVQSQWLQMSSVQTNMLGFLELGTIHKSSGCKYYYTAYWMPGAPVPVLEIISGQIASGLEHTFLLTRSPFDENEWQARIDNDVFWTTDEFGGETAWAAQAGLESAEGGLATVTMHGYYDLYIVDPTIGNFVPWDGSQINQVDNPPMCGRYINDQLWQAAQNSPCA